MSLLPSMAELISVDTLMLQPWQTPSLDLGHGKPMPLHQLLKTGQEASSSSSRRKSSLGTRVGSWAFVAFFFFFSISWSLRSNDPADDLVFLGKAQLQSRPGLPQAFLSLASKIRRRKCGSRRK